MSYPQLNGDGANIPTWMLEVGLTANDPKEKVQVVSEFLEDPILSQTFPVTLNVAKGIIKDHSATDILPAIMRSMTIVIADTSILPSDDVALSVIKDMEAEARALNAAHVITFSDLVDILPSPKTKDTDSPFSITEAETVSADAPSASTEEKEKTDSVLSTPVSKRTRKAASIANTAAESALKEAGNADIKARDIIRKAYITQAEKTTSKLIQKRYRPVARRFQNLILKCLSPEDKATYMICPLAVAHGGWALMAYITATKRPNSAITMEKAEDICNNLTIKRGQPATNSLQSFIDAKAQLHQAKVADLARNNVPADAHQYLFQDQNRKLWNKAKAELRKNPIYNNFLVVNLAQSANDDRANNYNLSSLFTRISSYERESGIKFKLGRPRPSNGGGGGGNPTSGATTLLTLSEVPTADIGQLCGARGAGPAHCWRCGKMGHSSRACRAPRTAQSEALFKACHTRYTALRKQQRAKYNANTPTTSRNRGGGRNTNSHASAALTSLDATLKALLATTKANTEATTLLGTSLSASLTGINDELKLLG